MGMSVISVLTDVVRSCTAGRGDPWGPVDYSKKSVAPPSTTSLVTPSAQQPVLTTREAAAYFPPSRPLKNLCRVYGLKLGIGSSLGLNPDALLYAICLNESSGGKNDIPRFEPAYAPNGYYFKRSQEVRDKWGKYGDLAAMSWGPWQIMFTTAGELGFSGSPLELWDAEVSIQFVVKLIKDRIIVRLGAKTVEEIGDSYNSGTFKDAVIGQVAEYRSRLRKNYEEALKILV